MAAEWTVVSIDDWALAGVETQGQHKLYWYRHDTRKRTWLFKPARPERHHAAPEDVVEKLGSEIAGLMGVPAARVELATLGSLRGALVEDARGHRWELQLGQVLMSEVFEDYDPSDRNHPGYNVQNVCRALDGFAAPPGFEPSLQFNAFDVFAGYLLLDALLAHCDRHDRNWAVISPPSDEPQEKALCPSYDHAASLGFQLSDQKREEYLLGSTGVSLTEWASKARATRFERSKGQSCQTLLELASSAVELCPTKTREYWRDRILSVECDSVSGVVAAAPDLTEIARRFTVELIMVNRGRVLDVLY